MKLSETLSTVVDHLSNAFPEVFPRPPAQIQEKPDLITVYALASAMGEIFHKTPELRVNTPLAQVQDSEGGLGILAAVLDYAWVFECVACELVDWEQNGEVWTYWVEDHAEEILDLTKAGEPDEHAFREAVRIWLGEQDLPLASNTPYEHTALPVSPRVWFSVSGPELPPENHEVDLLTTTAAEARGHRIGYDWFPTFEPAPTGAVICWAYKPEINK